jgi:hypothetical protein
MKNENVIVGVEPSMQPIVNAVVDCIIGSGDVQELLCINRSRLNVLVSEGKLVPVKELRKESLFWKPQVDALRKEMLKNTRTNLFKQSAKK